MDEEKKNIIQLMLGFVRRANGDHVSAYAAQAAYFLIMSFIPFILFLTTLIRYTPLSYNVVRDAIVGFVPGNLQTFVLSIVVEVYKRSTAIVPLSALMALWASGKGMQAIINGLNTIYHVKETRNWLMNRIYSVFYMLLFVLAIIVTLLVLVLGNRIQMAVQKTIPWEPGHCWCLRYCLWYFWCCIKCCPTGRQPLKASFPERLSLLRHG